MVAYDPQAPLYVKQKPAAPVAPTPAPKHVFVAPTAWKEPSEWKSPTNLLALADAKSGAVAGTWIRGEKDFVQSSKANGARLAIPFTLPAQYDIRATFERKSGMGDAALILAHNGKPFIWSMGADNNKCFVFMQVGGKKFDGNSALVRSSACLKNGQRYTTLVEVRKDRISAYLDGALVNEWVPSMGELSLEGVWKLPDGKQLGLGAWQSEVAFYSLDLVEIK